MQEKSRRKCRYRFNSHHETDNNCWSHGCQDNATIAAVVLNNKEKRVWIIYKSTPYLRFYCVHRCPEEFFDSEMLFDPFEKQFYLPATFV